MSVPPEVLAQMAQGAPQGGLGALPPPPPVVPVRKPKRGLTHMDDDDFAATMAAAVEDAIALADTEESTSREAALDAYHGAPYGDEEDGQCQFVSRDVHDTIAGQLPDIVRMLLGPEQMCVFTAQTPEDEGWVDTASRYVDQVITRQNDGFSVLYSAVKDALLMRKGVVKYWWDESEKVSTLRYGGLTDFDIAAVAVDPTLTLTEKTPTEDAGPTPAPVFDVTFQRVTKKRQVKLCAIPLEDFLVDRGATGLGPHEFTLLAHRDSTATVAKLVALGYDRDLVLSHSNSGDVYTDAVKYARREGLADFGPSLNDEGSRKVPYVDAFVYIDYDGDGIAELRRVCLMGSGWEVVTNEPVDDHPFAAVDVDPEPHAFYGESTADKVVDIQRLKTLVIRNVVDSLAQAVHPRTAAVEGQVNFDDLLNNEVGGVVRVRQMGAVQDLTTPFTGASALPVIDLLDTVREMRTGVSRQSLGLSSDALQSTTKLAVEQTVSGSQGKIELIARVMANGLTRLYAGILRLLVEKQDKATWMELAGRLIAVDPREWNAEVGVKVNVALGAGTQDQRAAALTNVISKQEQILQTLGTNQPIVSPAQYATALRKLTEMSGWRNPQMFFSEVPPGWQPPEQPPQPDPNQLAMQVQEAQIAAQERTAQIKAQTDLAIAQMEDARQRDKNVSDAILKNKQLELQFNASREQSAVRAAQGMEEAHIRQDTAREQMDNAARQQDSDRFEKRVSSILATPTPPTEGNSP